MRKLINLVPYFILLLTCCEAELYIDRIIVELCNNCSYTSYKLRHLTQTEDVIRLEVPEDSAFFIVQVHHLDPFTLSLSTNPDPSNSVHGSNLGVNQINTEKQYEFYMHNNFNNSRALFAITAYSSFDPMPGGCNMEFPMWTNPNQRINFTYDLITVDVQSPSLPNQICEFSQGNITMDFYQLYLDFNDFTEDSYYGALTSMLSVDNIKKYGTKITKPISGTSLRRFFSNYRCYGTAYAVIVTYQNGSAAHVPGFTYGCTFETDSCLQFKFEDALNIFFVVLISTYLLYFEVTYLDPILKCNFTPLLNIVFYGQMAITMKINYQLMIYYQWILMIFIPALFMFVLKRYAKLMMRIYMGCFLTALLYCYCDFQFMQMDYSLWLLLISMIFLMACLPASSHCCVLKFVQLYHGLLFCDFIAGDKSMMYWNIDAVRRVSVKHFNIASHILPHPSIYTFIAMTAFLIIRCLLCKWLKYCCTNRNEEILAFNEERRPLLNHNSTGFLRNFPRLFPSAEADDIHGHYVNNPGENRACMRHLFSEFNDGLPGCSVCRLLNR